MSDDLDRIRREHARWEREQVRGAPQRSETPPEAAGGPVEVVYTPAHGDGAYLEDLGFPGEPPFTRGIYPTMYRGRLWTMRQYAGYATAEESNRRYRYLLDHGQTGLSIAFDLPTQMGYDSDHPLAEAEVGKVGVAIDSLADMEALLDGIPLDRVSISMTINATAGILLAMLVATARRRGLDPARLDGTTQNDILKEYIARGTYIYPPAPSLRLVTDMFRYCATHLPRWNPISISGYHIREAGATAVQEVAFTLANGLTYAQAAVKAGLEIDRFAPSLSFFFAAQMNVLEEVAKFRAARRLWGRLVAERFQPRDARSLMLRFHTQTAGAALTAQQSENNAVRITLQALAAVLGGTQSLHTNARDEALALPTEETARLALRTQQILAHESGAGDTVDPLGGSYYVEALTARIEEGARDLLAQIEGAGGMLRAIETGLVQRMIAESAYREARQIESGEKVVVGVNRFAAGEEAHPSILRIDPSAIERQKARLARLRRERDAAAVRSALERVRRAAEGQGSVAQGQGSVAEGEGSVMEAVVEAVTASATVGEICDVLRAVLGTHRPAALV